ncbi:universal stress protein [Cryptosporangium arvum]|uniref:Usp family protein n=1 Tax=Cryptosporangium arvum DSM 44712 TaxID=927661 RepID=A0A010Z527_9ACTN|nr:universal stress protein [Cryptosporangium arvum]EXG82453.1 Usp family protein [Cryptosporangium arvum DSM 44712]
MTSIEDRGVVTVGLDSPATTGPAVQWALEYARTRGAAVRLIAGRPYPGPAEQVRARVDDLVLLSRSTVPGLDVVGEVAAEPLGPALLAAAQSSELVVIGDRASRRHASDLRPTVDALVAWAECPVVVARSARWPNPEAPIAAALDGSDRDDAVLDTALELAARCVSPLVAIQLSPDGPDRATAARVATRLAHRERAYARVPVRFRAAVGPAAPVLLLAARWASLLVVGPPRADGVTRSVTHEAVCPVLVARRPSVAPGLAGLGGLIVSAPV